MIGKNNMNKNHPKYLLVSINKQNKYKMTDLHYAALDGSFEKVKSLIEKGSIVNKNEKETELCPNEGECFKDKKQNSQDDEEPIYEFKKIMCNMGSSYDNYIFIVFINRLYSSGRS